MTKLTDKAFQRIGSKSNSHVGRDFERLASHFFSKNGLILSPEIRVPVGAGRLKKDHSFDLGCLDSKVLVECKSHKWTSGDLVPSAKLTVWNEAMYYFVAAPEGFRKILFVLKDFSHKRKETLAEYYIRIYKHLIPDDVELWEYDEKLDDAARLI